MTGLENAVLNAIRKTPGITHAGLIPKFLDHSTHEINDACVVLARLAGRR